ncbi:MAG: VTT domain-containing protein, partial [Mycobacteriales bacterium]
MTPRVRLAVLVVVISVLPVVLYVCHVVDAHGLRDAVRETGPWAPVVWVVVSALLGAALFPGPLLAGAGGLLLGATVGTVTTVVSAVLSALVSREIGERAGREGAVDLLGARADAIEHVGFEAVVVQRLAPGIPDAPLSYAFGSLGVTRRAMATGTMLGTLPRACSFTAIGASLEDPSS